MAGHHHPGAEEDHPEEQVAGPAGGRPEHGDEEHEDQHCEADVLLHCQDQHAEAPDQHDGAEGTGVGDEAPAQPGRRDGEQLLLLGEVGGEEDDEEDLGELHRLARDRADVDPQAHVLVVGAHGVAEVGDEGGEHEEHRHQDQQVAVAVQVPGPPHQEQGHDVAGHPDRGPHGLERGGVEVRLVDGARVT